jgi:hypothetical protein
MKNKKWNRGENIYFYVCSEESQGFDCLKKLGTEF